MTPAINAKAMNTRRQAYFGALKFFFQSAVHKNGPRNLRDIRVLYRDAKNDAAVYAFLAPTVNLTVWVPVWARG